MLKFSPANAKTKRLSELTELSRYLQGKRKVYSLDLPAGFTCPGAKDCMSRCVDGKIQDSKDTRFRCFSASQEVVYPNVHKLRMHNLAELKAAKTELKILELLEKSLPGNAGIVRYHVSGDFFNISYLKAAIKLAEYRPDMLFYGYTKSINLLCQIKGEDLSLGIVRPNFLMTASLGGKYDHVIGTMRTARVIFDESQANGLPIDHDDSHASLIGGSFALLLHGQQPAKTEAAKAWQIIKKNKGGYSR